MSVLVSLLIVAPAAANDKLPLASVTIACPAVPSAAGNVNVTFELTVAGACSAT